MPKPAFHNINIPLSLSFFVVGLAGNPFSNNRSTVMFSLFTIVEIIHVQLPLYLRIRL